MKSPMMVHLQRCVFILILVLAAVSASPQEPIYDSTWESIIENYSIPQWYEDGKFGIYVHWGVFQVPARYCLYGDEMYDENHPSFTHHRQTYGDQKTFGYKDFIPLYTMEKFDPEAWADLFVESGAKYIMPIAVFHDGVAQYKSNVIKKFNLVDYPGACGKDVLALLEKSVRARGLKFGITNQYLENWGYYCHNPNYDTSDPENVELYNTGEGGVCGDYFYTGYNGAVARKSWLNGMWLASVYEQVDMFKPDIIFFDMATQLGFDRLFDGQHLKTALTAYYYNAALKWGKQVAINMKVNSMPMGTHVHDHESSSLSVMPPLFWQSDTSLGNGWGYRAPYTCRTPAGMIRLLAENSALNGSVMLAIGNLPDGTLPPCVPPTLQGIGNWLKLNGEAIYNTRPWKFQKEGPTAAVGQSGANYTDRDIRFTADKAWTKIYAIGLDWPGSQMSITNMKAGSFDVSTIDSIYLIGGGKLTYFQDNAGLKVNIGAEAPIADYPYAVKIFLKTPERDAFAKIEAENCSNKRMGAIKVKTCSEGGQCLDSARSNDWAAYPKVNFGSGANEFEARVSASTVANSDIASIEVRLDDPSGPLIGTLTGACPGGINNYTTLTCSLTTTVTGIHDLYLVFNPGFRSYNLNWFNFKPCTVPVSTVYPAASHASVKSDLYAYYTRLDYKIPLSEIRMDVPFARRKQDAIDPDVEGRRRRRGSEITGKYADIVVHIDENRRLVFGRETSYCPWLETPRGRFPLGQLVECQPDPMCLSSYVRIIKNEPDEVLIHWCHVPDPESIVITEKIHELFAVTPGGMVVRQVKVGTQSLEDFHDPANLTVQKLQLTEAGFKELSLSKPELSGKPSEAVDGSPVRKNISASPAAWLKFDEGFRTRAAAEKQKTEESVGGTVCTISGNKVLWKRGVSGTSLAFDGYFSKVTLPRKKAPRLTDELTLEAWVVLGAYPWNDAGIVHQSAGEPITAEAYKHGYQDPYTYRPWKMEGYLLGIDPYGRPMFKVGGRQVGGGEVQPEETVSTEHVIPTYRWVHLAGVYGHGRMSLYMDGKLIEELPASGVIEVPDRDVLIGLNGDAQRISDPVSHSDFAANNNLPIVYGIEGLIDEVKIYDRALSDEQIQQSYRAFLPPAEGVDNPCLERRILPGEVTGRPSSKFGATYTTLEYHELWDNLWRPSSYRDIIVRFDALPANVVFWQGTNFGSGWVTENNRWMSDQSAEIGGPHGCAEHMADKRGRFGRVRLIENTDARVVVHWRYPSIDVGYVFPSPDVWADEYYTIYPDGVGVRYVARAKGGWHDTQFLTQAGTTCLDNLSLTALTVANMDGESADLTWEPPNRVPRNSIKDACIKVINFKSKWKVYAIYREGAEIQQWGHSEQSKHTPDPFAGPWNHWPVGLNPSDGRYAVSHDRITHAAIGGARRVGNFIMYGFTDKSATSLIPLAKAWNHPPTLTNLEGCESRGYRQTERAYILASKALLMSFTLNGSEETPIYNPCFAIENWTSENKSRLVVNGIEMESGKSFRQGITRDADGTMTLVVWVELESVSPVRFAVEDGEG